MRSSSIAEKLVLGLACLTGVTEAFPSPENLAKLAKREELTPRGLLSGLAQLQAKAIKGPKLFDPLTDPIQVDGIHEFQPPKAGDQRGPCPGLNALANHGYLSRDGVVGYLEAVEGINTVFGMGLDLATIIAAMGVVGTGNPLSLKPSFSIGGVSPKVKGLLGNLLGLTGTPRGLDGSHNFIEADSSNTRDDLYVTGDATTMNMDLFMDIYDSIDGVMNMEQIGDRAAARLEESIATNPIFYYGPYTGLIVRNAGFLFGARLLSNHSLEHPQGGQMDKETFKSMWGVVESANGTLTYNRGWERIPSNWYRIHRDYTLTELNIDLVSWISKHPSLANMGGNLGQVNSFAGIDLEDITGGALNAVSLLEGNNLICFSLEIAKAFAPNALSSLFTTLSKPLQLINDALLDPLLDLNCPAMGELEKGGKNVLAELLKTYPGAKKSGFAL